jgi:hypothetical protein
MSARKKRRTTDAQKTTIFDGCVFALGKGISSDLKVQISANGGEVLYRLKILPHYATLCLIKILTFRLHPLSPTESRTMSPIKKKSMQTEKGL